MRERQPATQKEIIIGGIYIHLNNPQHRYQVLETGLDDTTGYEQTGKIAKMVRYKQLYQGDYPPGHIWYKREDGFLGDTEIDGKTVPTFTFVEMGNGDNA